MRACRCSDDRSYSISPSLRVRTQLVVALQGSLGRSGIAEVVRACLRATLTMGCRHWSDHGLRLVVRYVNDEPA
jgi:hypothetical protein